MIRFRCLTLAATLFFAGSAFAQTNVSGTVTDADTGEALPGASVIVEGTTMGAATDGNGRYAIGDLPSGTHTLTVSFVGYDDISRVVTVRSSDVTADFRLAFASEALEALEVFASRAVDRKTPVAFTNVDKVQIQRELGSRDVPLVLNVTPSVYGTAQGGGAGDARVNVRGFNQRNVAIMINGVPVNDMENGWVYWSNWDGVGDAASSIQLQRGLSVVNLATPSIGGALNIITDPSQNTRQVMAKQEVGNDRHRLDFYAVGAPQRHGQNLYRQNIAAYDHGYAREVFKRDGLDRATIDDILETFPEAGRRWNENVSSVSSQYGMEQHDGFGTVRRIRAGQINERENFFHKPQLNLNHYAQLSDKSLLSTVVYYSGGKGGGSGTKGSLEWDYSGPSRVIDYNAMIASNRTNGQSLGILRNSQNVQWTIGAISKFKHEPNENVTLEAGIDWRTAEIEHYRTVRELLGLARFDIRVLANVFNVFDSFYIQDATNNSPFNAYRGNGRDANTADDAEVFLGLPRTFNVGVRVVFR